jgi:hypothetical protein
MRNAAHAEFIRDVRDLIKRIGAGVLGITALFAEYEARVEKEIALFEYILKSLFTAQLEALDKLRDEIIHGFALAIEALIHHPLAAKREAAAAIRLIFEHYGNLTRLNYDEESSTADDLIRELENAVNKPLVAAAGLTEWVAGLKSVNEEFIATMHTRDTETAQRPETQMKDARADVDKVLYDIVARVEAMIVLNGIDYTTGLSPFVHEWNALVERYKHRLAVERGRRHAKKEKEEEGNEEL